MSGVNAWAKWLGFGLGVLVVTLAGLFVGVPEARAGAVMKRGEWAVGFSVGPVPLGVLKRTWAMGGVVGWRCQNKSLMQGGEEGVRT